VSGYADLAVLADRELARVREARWEEAAALSAERDALAGALGPAAPEDRPALELLIALQEQLVVEVTLARDAAARELAAVSRGRGAVRGYRSAAAGPAAGVRLEA
jgi:hypothetical protein